MLEVEEFLWGHIPLIHVFVSPPGSIFALLYSWESDLHRRHHLDSRSFAMAAFGFSRWEKAKSSISENGKWKRPDYDFYHRSDLISGTGFLPLDDSSFQMVSPLPDSTLAGHLQEIVLPLALLGYNPRPQPW